MQNLSEYPAPRTFRNEASKPQEDEGGCIFIEERNLTLVLDDSECRNLQSQSGTRQRGRPMGVLYTFRSVNGAAKALF
ncbi:hypothetical protein E5358_14635 [Palleniella muris]|uniref:Uncharacterized protein n=1 Tax=Palleniella muris TaxID=3038145 RepID=A0AC61QLI2_9BACT|nr:hypothetical protein [Palleniella muris]TGX79632.1 hypothetical protein E5358_14635 [Palleniella muris]